MDPRSKTAETETVLSERRFTRWTQASEERGRKLRSYDPEFKEAAVGRLLE